MQKVSLRALSVIIYRLIQTNCISDTYVSELRIKVMIDVEYYSFISNICESVIIWSYIFLMDHSQRPPKLGKRWGGVSHQTITTSRRTIPLQDDFDQNI